jgi:polysaccharide export outer membrane protein
MAKRATRSLLYILVVMMSTSIFSCRIQRIAYFKDISDSIDTESFQTTPISSPVVMADDVLNIMVQTLDPNANAVLNQGNLAINAGATTSGGGLGQQAVAGYLVDADGFIHMPYIGDLQVRNMTTTQVRQAVQNKMSMYFKDPVVNVRFSNFKITVLGEVRNPTSFLVPNENPTIIDAIGLAGDITIYGRRDNVMLIRTGTSGQRQVTRINLDSSSAFNSGSFYLRPNDVVYVEPTSDRVQSTSAYRTRDIAVISSALSLMIIITARLIR